MPSLCRGRGGAGNAALRNCALLPEAAIQRCNRRLRQNCAQRPAVCALKWGCESMSSLSLRVRINLVITMVIVAFTIATGNLLIEETRRSIREEVEAGPGLLRSYWKQ